MEKCIGREQELAELARAMESSRSEFVILYGRRRIGKTFLVRSYFQDTFDFHYVGAHNMPTVLQLRNFRRALSRFSGNAHLPEFASWLDAFEALEDYLESLGSARRKVLFFDEMPWIDAKQSDFVSALEYFWNSWVSLRDDIVLISCGSATSWMMDKLVANPGGLHNRITRQLYLRPFSLRECSEYLAVRGFDWDFYQIMQCYMALGGVPFYWSLLDSGLSLPQNLDRLCFQRSGTLRSEFDELYHALFSNAERYVSVVQALAGRREGLFRDEIGRATGVSGGTLSKLLKNLERCDFVSSYSQFGKKSKQAIYRLTDFFTLFYLKFVQDEHTYDKEFWSHHFQSPQVAVWEGLTFELVCLAHLPQIKKALGISGMETHVAAWRYVPPRNSVDAWSESGAQIDFLIERADKVTHLCECKFAVEKFNLTKEYEQHLRERLEIFRRVTKKTGSLVHTFITPFGVAQGKHHSIVHSEVTAKELFAE